VKAHALFECVRALAVCCLLSYLIAMCCSLCVGKTMDDVASRKDLLAHWAAQEIEPPQRLAEKVKLKRGLACRLWWRYFRDRGSCGGVLQRIFKWSKRICTTRRGIEKDVEAHLQVSFRHIRYCCIFAPSSQ
jgi:hypothetical protein